MEKGIAPLRHWYMKPNEKSNFFFKVNVPQT